MNTTIYKGKAITSDLLGAGFWAKCGNIYEGGYRTERSALNAVKRQLDKKEQG